MKKIRGKMMKNKIKPLKKAIIYSGSNSEGSSLTFSTKVISSILHSVNVSLRGPVGVVLIKKLISIDALSRALINTLVA